MRLTLRTMLAYMDGILGPEDAEDIGKKIEDSEYATNLLHRTRDLMRRLRLAAPQLAQPGQALDPNTVAEYLDNILHDGRVPDFEKVCLESDIHLAEVASCHQILALVLGEAAEIDAAARQRMYQLPHLQTAQAGTSGGSQTAEEGAGDAPSPGESASSKPRQKPTVPDYLREPPKRRRFMPVAAALLLVACLAFAVLVLLSQGQFEPGTPLGNLLGMGRADQQVAGGAGQEVALPAQSPAGPVLPDELPDELPDDTPPAEDGAAEPAAAADEPGQTPPDQVARTDPALVEPSPAQPPAAEPADEPAEEPADDTPTEPADGPITQKDPAPPEQPPAPSDQPDRERMGRLMSEAQVLLSFDPQSKDWRRVPAKGTLFPRQRLVALPTYRPEITLQVGLTIELLGGTRIELLSRDEQDLAGLRIDYGRVRLMPLAEAGKRLRLAVGSYSGVITFVDADSTAALEVTPMYSPGTDPETESATLVTHLYAVTGKISWDGGTESGSVEIAAPECLVLDGQPVGSPPVVRELPKWIAEEMVGLLDRRASATIEPSLEVDRPTGLGLLELGDHRQKEVRWLAARCLAHIGRFEPLVAAIDNQEMKQEWENYIEKLREAVRRDGPSAAGVRRTMEQQFGEAAADAYRMLWGYTPVDMIKGQDAKLVELLEHETLALRVLSFWSLKEITGLGLFYKPDQTAAKRQQSVQRWKQKLQAGQIRFKLPEGTQESREKVTPAKPPSPAGSG